MRVWKRIIVLFLFGKKFPDCGTRSCAVFYMCSLWIYKNAKKNKKPLA